MQGEPAQETGSALRRPGLGAEVLLVLGLSFGAAGIWALLRLVRMAMQPGGVGGQNTYLNVSATPVAWLDVLFQLSGAVLDLVPVGMALYLLAVRPALLGADRAAPTNLQPASPWRAARTRLGFDLSRPWRDLGLGALLAAGVGLPGISFYWLGRQMGITANVSTNNLPDQWWAFVLLNVAALAAGISEEVVVVGYLVQRLEQMSWAPWAVLAGSALLRGSYHLYQGFGPFAGNVVMGLVFVLVFRRTRRVMPLVLAHWLMDIVAFVGPTLLGLFDG